MNPAPQLRCMIASTPAKRSRSASDPVALTAATISSPR